MMRKLFFILSFILLFASCSLFDSGSPQNPVQNDSDSYCTFHLSVDGDARDVVPAYDATSYWYVFSYLNTLDSLMSDTKTVYFPPKTADGTLTGADYSTLTTKNFTILVGTYKFTLDAYLDEACTRKVLSATKNITLTTSTTTLPIELSSPNSSDTTRVTTGSVSVPVVFPAAANIATVGAKLLSVSGSVADEQADLAITDASGENKRITYSASDIPEGTYILQITLTDTDGHKTFIPQMVTVRGGAVSSPEKTAENPSGICILDDRMANVRHTVTYANMDDGSGTSWWAAGVVDGTFISGQTVTLPSKERVFREEYAFTGWYESADENGNGTGTAITQIVDGNADVTLYAGWKKAYAMMATTSSEGVTTKACYGTLSETVSAIRGATDGTLSVTLYSEVTKEDFGTSDSSGTIAYAVRTVSSGVTGVNLDMSRATLVTEFETATNGPFYQCNKLTGLTLPSSLETIQARTFYTSNIASVTFDGWDNALYRWSVTNGTETKYLRDSGAETNATNLRNAMKYVEYTWTKTALAGIPFVLKTGTDIRTILRNDTFKNATAFLPSETAPSEESEYYLDTAEARVPLWLDSDGTTARYFADGCTNGTQKIPMNASSSYMFAKEDSDVSDSEWVTIDIHCFDASSVTDMYGLFMGCSNLTSINVKNWNTEQVTSMNSVFKSCSKLTELDISGWNTANVTNMGYFFGMCSSLQEITLGSAFNTAKVTDMSDMFNQCSALVSVDVSRFDTGEVTSMEAMFSSCYELTKIIASNSFVTTATTTMGTQNMFSGCTKLVGGLGTPFDSSKTDGTYAHIDDGTDNPGYFTPRTNFYAASTSGSPAGSDEYGDGSQTTPFATVSKAITEINDQNHSKYSYTVHIDGTLTGCTTVNTLSMTGLTIEGKTGATTDKLDGDSGGSVLKIASAVPVTLKNLTVTGGSAECGGGLYLDGANLTLSDGAVITGNTATINGGGVYSENTTLAVNGTAIITGNTVQDNGSGYGGGGIYVKDGTFTLSGGTISTNTAGLRGGGVMLHTGATMTFSDGLITKNSAGSYGAGILVDTGSTGLTMTGGTVSENVMTATSTTDAAGGGGIYVATTAQISGGTISGNSTNGVNLGGGVFVGGSGSLTLSGGTISGNTSLNGGGIGVNGGTLTMTGGTVSLNSATTSGGGVYNIGTFTMSGGTISGNTASTNTASSANTNGGGGVYSSGTMYMYGTAVIGDSSATEPATASLRSNYAAYGGGIYNAAGGKLYLGYSSYTDASNNTSETLDGGVYYNGAYNGGGIYDEAAVIMQSGTIGCNFASNYGGGIETAKSTMAISGGLIIKNKAREGGGIYISTNSYPNTLSGTLEIAENRADYYGGGIYLGSPGVFTLRGNVTIHGNTSLNGGGIMHHSDGTFYLGEGATVASDNDVKTFWGREKITIQSNLTGTSPVMTITPGAYTAGAQLLKASSSSFVTANYDKIAVTPRTGETWVIDSTGYLQTEVTNGISISAPDYTSDNLELVATPSADGTKYVFTAKAGYDSYVWSIDGTFATTTTNTHSVNLSDLSSGTHTLLLVATDSGGKYHDAQVTITIE